jgi:hypothetical protein
MIAIAISTLPCGSLGAQPWTPEPYENAAPVVTLNRFTLMALADFGS